MNNINEKYKFIQQFGEQSKRKFGSVWLVQNKLSAEYAVLKTLLKQANNIHLQDRIKQEATFDFKFDGLPRTLDLIETETKILLLKNYLPGTPLNVFWKKIAPRNRFMVLLTILEKLVPILDHLAEQNSVHCDIKPSNILVNEVDSEISVALIDFGLALNLTHNNQRSVIFPLGYASPELILNKLELVDQRSDLFSIGIVIWRILNDKLPLSHPNPAIYTNLQLVHPIPNGIELAKGMNALLNKMCSKPSFRNAPNLMNKDEVELELKNAIENRYDNLQQFIDELKILPIRKRWFFF